MIVKNESRIIERLIQTVLPLIDTYCICDTGSTDDTVAIIERAMGAAGVSGEVFSESFRNFGYNRTVALERAARWADFALLLDADMKLVIEPGFTKATLFAAGADVIQIQQRSPSLVYSNTRIVRTGRGITCVGPTHEYYNVPPGLRTVSLTGGLWINDIGDGGSKADKFQRDIRLLTEALVTDPNNGRHLFYLGNSQRDVGDHRAAIESYKRRLTVGGWDEELFMTALYIGNCYDKLGDGPNACYWWLEAYNRRPKRAESLHALCKYYRIHSKHALAYMIWEKGSAIPYPTGDTLFVNPEVYDTGFLYEQSILAYYLKKPVDHRAYMRLFSSSEYQSSAISNYKFYARKLKDLPGSSDIDFSDTVEKVVAGRGMDTFRSSSPCIITHPSGSGGYMMNVRYVNYKISPQGGYEFRHSDGKITTLNRILWLDCDLKYVTDHWFDDVANPHLRYQGVEDVRIFTPTPDGPVRFIGTLEHPTKGLISIGTGDYSTASPRLTPTVYESPTGRTCEKNWVPADGHRLIYDWSPLTVMDASTGVIMSRDPAVPAFFSLLRGSTGGAPVGDELWFVCHFVEYSTPRHYYHLIVVLDRETLRYRRHSTPFKFHGDPIEYCLGLVVEPTRVLMSYSRWDRTSAVMSVLRREFENTFFETDLRTPHFVVNLERRPDRRDAARKALETGGMRDVRFFNAVDGKTLTATKEITDIFRNNRFGSRRGIIGCAMSHYHLWQQLVSDPANDYFIVLEDDITVVDTFASAVEETIQRCRQENIDLLFIGFHTKKKDYTFQQSLQVTPRFVPFFGDDYVGGTFGYILSKKGAQTYLDYVKQNGMNYAVDMIVYGLQGRMNIRFCSPPLVSSSYVSEVGSTVDSDIQKDTDTLEFL